MAYNLSTEEIISTIKKERARRVLIQLPDGLKPEAEYLQKILFNELPDVEIFFWGGSSFGACDLPLHVDRLGFDLLLHFGHAKWV